MRYVRRNKETGKVDATYAHPNVLAQECLEDNHPDILAWNEEKLARAQEPSKVSLLEDKVALLQAQLEQLMQKMNE